MTMQALPATLRLYLKLAIDRRQILAQHLAMRIALAGVAAILLLVGLALLNVALFVFLRPMFGDLLAVLVVAGLHILFGLMMAAIALREPASAELTALAEAEAAALTALDSEAQGTMAGVIEAERRIQSIGAGLSLTANALPSVLAMLARSPRPVVPDAADPASPDKPTGDKA